MLGVSSVTARPISRKGSRVRPGHVIVTWTTSGLVFWINGKPFMASVPWFQKLMTVSTNSSSWFSSQLCTRSSDVWTVVPGNDPEKHTRLAVHGVFRDLNRVPHLADPNEFKSRERLIWQEPEISYLHTDFQIPYFLCIYASGINDVVMHMTHANGTNRIQTAFLYQQKVGSTPGHEADNQRLTPISLNPSSTTRR